MKKRDIILIAVISVIAGGSYLTNRYLNRGNQMKVEIYVENKLYRSLPLDIDKTVEIYRNGEKNKIHIHNNGVEMISANCRDRICVKEGFINKPGEDIVCLPHKINVKIVSQNAKKDIDVKTR